MYRVQRLNRKDGRLIDIICESLKTAYDPAIARFFVHQDVGYKRFFNSILEHPSYATFYSYDSISNELLGFACFQLVEEIIFLKHIVVNNKLRGSKIGTKLLQYALAHIRETTPKQEFLFQLHVFEKNSRALSWYLSIGMQIIDCSYWYDLYPAIIGLSSSMDIDPALFNVSSDSFGFKQVSYKDIYIGTWLAQKTLIVKNLELVQRLDLVAGFVQTNNIESIGMVSRSSLDFELVDKALLMSTPINSMEFI